MSQAPPKKAFALRLDPALYAAVERMAASELRSANAEIEVLLREALGRRGVTVKPPTPPKRGRPPRESRYCCTSSSTRVPGFVPSGTAMAPVCRSPSSEERRVGKEGVSACR